MRRLLGVLLLVCAAPAVAGAQTQAGRWPSESAPRPLPAHDVNFPAYEVRTLPNGLQVVAVLHHEQPVVSMRMLVRAGSALDPKDKLGLAHLTASLLDQGTTTKTATEMNDAIDFMGAEVGVGAGTDLSFINAVVQKDSFQTGLDMLADIVRHPAFDPAEVERQRQQLLSSLDVSREDPDYLASSVFDRLVYGFHPYGLPDSGTTDTIKALTRDDVVAFHRRNFVPNNAILAIVGDVTAEEAFNGVTRVFGDWPRQDVPKTTFVAPPQPTRRLIVVNKPDAVQTEVRVGQIGIRRNHPDYMAVNLAIRILGGEGANRLHQVLRTERGLTYGAEANMNTLLETGDFEAQTNTRSAATGEVLRLMVDEFWRLQRDRVSERELNDAKAYITGSFPLTIETPDAIATQVLNVLFYGLPIEELQSYRDRVNAVTPDDVQRVARAYLQPDRLSIALVGNAAAFLPQLKGVGFGTFETINMEDLDLTTVDFKRQARRAGGAGGAGRAGGAGQAGGAGRAGRPERAAYAQQAGVQARPAASASESEKARILLDRVIAAKGGLDRLRAIKTLVVTTRAEATTPDGTLEAETTTSLQYPNRIHVETTLPDGKVVQVYDGSRGWMKDPSGVHDVPDTMTPQIEATFRRDPIAMLLALHDGTMHARVLPDVKDSAGRVHQALEVSATTMDPLVLLIDPDTGLIDKSSYVAAGPGRPLVEEVFGDYKPVGGVQFPFTTKVTQGGRPVLDRHALDFKINEPLDAALFKRPS